MGRLGWPWSSLWPLLRDLSKQLHLPSNPGLLHQWEGADLKVGRPGAHPIEEAVCHWDSHFSLAAPFSI